MKLPLVSVILLAALAAASDEGVSLKFNWRAGQEVRHQVRVEGQVLENGRPLQSLSYQGRWVRKIVAVDREGVASFEATTEEVRRSEGFWLYDFGGFAPGYDTGGRIKPNGRVIEVEHARAGDPEYWSLLIFPDQPVALGGVWKDRPPTEQLVQQMGVRARGEVTYQLEERVRYKSRTCLKITRESRFQVGFDPRQQFKDLKIETRGTLWFDELAGNLVDAEIQEIFSAQRINEGQPPKSGEDEPSGESAADSTGGGKVQQISAQAKMTFTLVR
jgi:hypothetical protein